jgi:hypothetical protein
VLLSTHGSLKSCAESTRAVLDPERIATGGGSDESFERSNTESSARRNKLYKRSKRIKRTSAWLGIGLGCAGFVLVWVVLLVDPGQLEYTPWHTYLLASLLLGAIGLSAGWGIPTVIYLIYAGLRPGAEDSPDKSLNRQQRTVVWILAWLLSAFSMVQGVSVSKDWHGEFSWRSSSMLWLAVLPIVLLGCAAFLHFMQKRK